jgi:hypothetical protein
MSQVQKGILGALAVGLTLGVGVVQFAFGHDLIGGQIGRQVDTSVVPETAASVVNRAAKVDRAEVPVSGRKSQTIALKLDGLPDTSVLVRVLFARDEARGRPVGPGLSRPGEGRKVACEPVVSVLTDVAKLLQPGRCIT